MKHLITILYLFSSNAYFAQNRFTNDAELRKIYGFEYERKSDSILPYLISKDHKYRYTAIKSVASIQDTNVVTKLVEILEKEKIDSVKLAIIYSLGQLDCQASFSALINYHHKIAFSSVKSACLAAIGKVAKNDVTTFYLQSFSSNTKPDVDFISNWLKGLYLAKRRKQIDLEKNNQQLIHFLDTILESNLGRSDEVNFYYSKLVNKATVASPELVKITPKNKQEIDTQLKLLKTPYLQLDAIVKFNLSDTICKAFIFSEYHPLIKSYALDYFIRTSSWNDKIDATFMQTIFDQMDVALISRICEYITDQKQQKKSVDISVDVLQNTQRQLFLPQDFETWIDLQKAILSFEGKTYHYQSCFETGYKNPIDWNYIVKIDAMQKVKITTNKGSMELILKVNESPASVANFLKLVDQGYYNGKYFHRMVPNFVVQGGCPRGDGWGSLDWNQRTELSGNSSYKKGSVGLASVGKDSEGVQFFISHTYAPHLDGRYTIFAEVIKGLDIIGNLLVGDEIIAIESL